MVYIQIHENQERVKEVKYMWLAKRYKPVTSSSLCVVLPPRQLSRLGSPAHRASTPPNEPPRQLSMLGSPAYRAGTPPTEPPRQLSRLGSPAYRAGTPPTEPPRQLSRLGSPAYRLALYPLSHQDSSVGWDLQLTGWHSTH